MKLAIIFNDRKFSGRRRVELELGIGLLDDVDAAIAAIHDPIQRRAAEIEWEYATVIERNSPLVTVLSAQLGLDAATLDNLFLVGGTL